MFNFLSEQEVRITEPSSCLPLFSLQNSKINPLFSQLPPPFLHSYSGRSRGGDQVGQSPPTFCLHVLLFHYFGITIIFGKTRIIALPLYDFSNRLVVPDLQVSCLNRAFFCSP